MAGWIGTLGDLAEFKCPSKLSRSGERAMSRFTGLDGTDTMFVGTGRTARSWDVDLSAATPDDVRALELIEHGARGVGPFLFVDPLMAATNVLTPRQSLMEPDTLPPRVTPSRTVVPGLGSMPAAITEVDVVARFGNGSPVVPGTPVTVSAWVVSTAAIKVSAQCMRVDGSWTNNESRTQAGFESGGWVSVTVTPAADAAKVDLRIQSSAPVVVACPSIKWSTHDAPWAVGQGVAAVVVEPISVDALRATSAQQLVDASVRIQEVRVANA